MTDDPFRTSARRVVASFSQHRLAPRTLAGLAGGLLLGVLLLIIAIPLVLLVGVIGLIGAGVLRVRRAFSPGVQGREPLSGRRNVRVLRPHDDPDR